MELFVKFRVWFQNRAGHIHVPMEIANIAPGSPVMNSEIAEGIMIREMISRGDFTAVNRIQQGVAQFGPNFVNQVGRVHIRNGI